MGADDYLVKSFAIEELIARVEALGRRRYQQSSPILGFRFDAKLFDKNRNSAGKDLKLPAQLFPC